MSQKRTLPWIVFLALLVTCAAWLYAQQDPDSAGEEAVQALGKPATQGGMALREALARRRSVRAYAEKPLTDEQIAQLCWAAQGITEPKRGLRTAPSAGAMYPLELYVVTGDGVWRYVPADHALKRLAAGDLRKELQQAALGQGPVGSAPAVFVIAGVFERTTKKYGQRAGMYVLVEVGHAAQNLLLQAVADGLGTVPIGAFRTKEVQSVLGLPEDHVPLYLIPVGVPKSQATGRR